MDQSDDVELEPDRAAAGSRPTERHRGRLALLVVFVIGAIVGSAVVSTFSSGSPADSPQLRIAVAEVERFGTTGELTVALRVTNDGAEQVHIERVSAETNGYALLHAAPRPPEGGPPLQVDPGADSTVGLTVRPYCFSDGASNVTLLLVLADQTEPGRTVAFPVPELDRRLRDQRRSLCGLSHRPGDYSARMLDARTPKWAGGRLLVVDLLLAAAGPRARGLELADVSEHIAGVRGHFHRTDDPGMRGTLAGGGVSGELWLRMADCQQAAQLEWDRSWRSSEYGVGIELYVEKPAAGSALTVSPNSSLLSRVHRWVDTTCATP